MPTNNSLRVKYFCYANPPSSRLSHFEPLSRLFEIIRSSHSYGYEPACMDGRKKNEHRLDYQVENPDYSSGQLPTCRRLSSRQSAQFLNNFYRTIN